MSKAFVLLIVVLAIITTTFTTFAEDSCNISVTEVNGIHVVKIQGCEKVQVVANGAQVFPIVTAVVVPTLVSTPALTNGAPVPNSTDFLDKGSAVVFTDTASLLITNEAANYMYVHIKQDLYDGYVQRDVMGKAARGSYYSIVCKDDTWYKIKYNGVEGWVKSVGSVSGRIYATVSIPAGITISECPLGK